MSFKLAPQGVKTVKPAPKPKSTETWLPKIAWGVAIILVALAVFLLVKRVPAVSAGTLPTGIGSVRQPAVIPAIPADSGRDAALPAYAGASRDILPRHTSMLTEIPVRPSVDGTEHTIATGDSIFGLSEEFKLKPETILWANYSVLNDNPDMLSLGQNLIIPPTDGVFYQWKDGDNLQEVAGKYKAKAQDILLWPGNRLDLVTPEIKPGAMIMIPGGKREFRQAWVIPVIPRGAAGVTTSIPGACNTGSGGAYGSGSFMWPSSIHTISGNNFWSGHLAVDIAVVMGMPVYAADSGVVVYAGWNNSGYGYMVMIDHGNGYQTLYAHLSGLGTVCGSSVYKGNVIGYGGSTGYSTGAHLHFEVRFMGGFINPLTVMR